MIKPTLFVYGNIICRCEFKTSTLDNFYNVKPWANPIYCDLSEAIIIGGDFVCDSVDVKNHYIACTGEIRALNESPTVGNLKIGEEYTICEK